MCRTRDRTNRHRPSSHETKRPARRDRGARPRGPARFSTARPGRVPGPIRRHPPPTNLPKNRQHTHDRGSKTASGPLQRPRLTGQKPAYHERKRDRAEQGRRRRCGRIRRQLLLQVTRARRVLPNHIHFLPEAGSNHNPSARGDCTCTNPRITQLVKYVH